MWAGGEALGEEEPKVLTGSLLGAAKASATRTRMPPPPGGGRRGQVEEPVKSFYLTCPPPACFYLFICLAAVVHF